MSGQPVRALDWVGVAVLTACGVLAGLLSAVLVPFYVGSTTVPIAVVLAIVANVVLPRLAHSLVPRTGATALPFVGWLVVVLGIAITARPEGDVILPGGDLQWVTYGVLLGGAIAGTATLVLTSPPRPTRSARRSYAGSRR